MVFISIIGMLAYLVGSVGLIVQAFRESLLWGLATLLIPLAGIVFAIYHWRSARVALVLALGGLALCANGVVMTYPVSVELPLQAGPERSASIPALPTGSLHGTPPHA